MIPGRRLGFSAIGGTLELSATALRLIPEFPSMGPSGTLAWMFAAASLAFALRGRLRVAVVLATFAASVGCLDAVAIGWECHRHYDRAAEAYGLAARARAHGYLAASVAYGGCLVASVLVPHVRRDDDMVLEVTLTGVAAAVLAYAVGRFEGGPAAWALWEVLITLAVIGLFSVGSYRGAVVDLRPTLLGTAVIATFWRGAAAGVVANAYAVRTDGQSPPLHNIVRIWDQLSGLNSTAAGPLIAVLFAGFATARRGSWWLPRTWAVAGGVLAFVVVEAEASAWFWRPYAEGGDLVWRADAAAPRIWGRVPYPGGDCVRAVREDGVVSTDRWFGSGSCDPGVPTLVQIGAEAPAEALYHPDLPGRFEVQVVLPDSGVHRGPLRWIDVGGLWIERLDERVPEGLLSEARLQALDGWLEDARPGRPQPFWVIERGGGPLAHPAPDASRAADDLTERRDIWRAHLSSGSAASVVFVVGHGWTVQDVIDQCGEARRGGVFDAVQCIIARAGP